MQVFENGRIVEQDVPYEEGQQVAALVYLRDAVNAWRRYLDTNEDGMSPRESLNLAIECIVLLIESIELAWYTLTDEAFPGKDAGHAE